ncbi:MAG: hypothetical protein ACJA2S_004557 [Cyclobacteriaceae bacterium]|jgi:hypothetical protein
MEQIQLIQIEPSQLVDLIKDGVKTELQAHAINLQGFNRKDEKEFLTRKETSEFFGITLVTVHDWVNKKIIKPYKMGNKTFFCYKELVKALLDSNRSQ